MSDIVIKIDNVSKIYKLYDKPLDRLREALSFTKKKYSREHYALKKISVQIKKGETIGIIGTNGSGKSTLLKIITGVLTQTSGKVEINGKISALLELGAGFNPDYTGIENIYLNGTIMGYTREEISKKLDSIIEFAEIGDFINQPVKTYSSGMFARLAFAVSINVDPDILIVDEALSVGDIKFQMKCIEKMNSLKLSGTTILFVSHALEQVKRFCDRAIWINCGEIKEDGEVSKITDLYEYFLDIGNLNAKKFPLKMDLCESTFDNNTGNSVANIKKIVSNAKILKITDSLQVEVKYEIFEEKINNFLLGVAIYTKDRNYIFGPNTYLEKVYIPNTRGEHVVIYKIPRISLIKGEYVIDVGIFTDKGLVCLDYKSDTNSFVMQNDYISEGLVYLNHTWEIIK